jgi:hypothetical protein
MKLSAWCLLVEWMILLQELQEVGSYDIVIHPWRWRAPTKFPVQKGVRGYDFMINRTGMTWQWTLPQYRRIPYTPKDLKKLSERRFTIVAFMTFEFWAPHNGWIGCGLCERQGTLMDLDGKMEDCDLILAWVDQTTGEGHVCVSQVHLRS